MKLSGGEEGEGTLEKRVRCVSGLKEGNEQEGPLPGAGAGDWPD